MARKLDNPLLEKMSQVLANEPRGKMLDLGCGGGNFAKQAKDLGFEVVACDIEEEGFSYYKEIEFIKADITKKLPFPDETFDTLLFLEVIEHLHNPYFVVSEINRVLKKNSCLFISTPNVLNLKSRLRFLIEGTFDFYREPPLEQINNPKEKDTNIHLFVFRYSRLEYMLAMNGFEIKDVFTSCYEPAAKPLSFLIPIIKMQAYFKCRRSLKKGGTDFRRLYKVTLSKDLLFGRHLVIKAIKKNNPSQKVYRYD